MNCTKCDQESTDLILIEEADLCETCCRDFYDRLKVLLAILKIRDTKVFGVSNGD